MDTVFLAGTGLVILGLVIWIVCVVVAYRNAPRRGRRPVVWAILAVLFGPIALFALMLMAPKAGQAGSGSRAGHAASRDPRADLYEVPKKR